MLPRNHTIQHTIICLVAACFGTVAYCCAPLPVLLFKPDVVYASKGLKIPELPDNAVAKIGDTFILETDYKDWLYQKIGFETRKHETFVLRLALDKYLRDRGIDPDQEKQTMLDNFFDFDETGLTTSTNEWLRLKNQRAESGVVETAGYRSEILSRLEDNYLGALYVMENWDTLYEAGPKDFGAPPGLFDVEGAPADIRHIVHLNNALKMYNQYYSIIAPIMKQEVLAGQDMNISSHLDAYKDWIYEEYHTEFLLENYLGMIISDMNAEKHNLRNDEAVAQQEFELRIAEYRKELDAFNRNLPDSTEKMELSPVYADYTMLEVQEDLLKSRAYRNERPMKPHQIELRIHEDYGYKGEQLEVREIFKWVRQRNSGQAEARGQALAAEKSARVRSELNQLRERILAADSKSFQQYAITENDMVRLQKTAGRIDLDEDLMSLYSEQIEALGDLEVNEISPIIEGPGSRLSIFWIAGIDLGAPVIYGISKNAPIRGTYDYRSYQDGIAAAHEALSVLKTRIEGGEAILELAQEHSDNFSSTGGDISDTYLEEHGFQFAEALHSVPVGGLKIVDSDNGVHLVQVLSRTRTEITDAIKNRIVEEYNRELADQQERYVITEKMFQEYQPYFEY